MRRLLIPAGAATGVVLGVAVACGEFGWKHWRADRRKRREPLEAIYALHSGAVTLPPDDRTLATPPPWQAVNLR